MRAWRTVARFEGRSSLHSWLYRIVTNTCLDMLARRRKRVLPIATLGLPSNEHSSLGPVLGWVQVRTRERRAPRSAVGNVGAARVRSGEAGPQRPRGDASQQLTRR